MVETPLGILARWEGCLSKEVRIQKPPTGDIETKSKNKSLPRQNIEKRGEKKKIVDKRGKELCRTLNS